MYLHHLWFEVESISSHTHIQIGNIETRMKKRFFIVDSYRRYRILDPYKMTITVKNFLLKEHVKL